MSSFLKPILVSTMKETGPLECREPCKRVVNVSDIFKVGYGISLVGWTQSLGKMLESFQIFTQLEIWNVIDDVEQSNASTRIVDSLETLE